MSTKHNESKDKHVRHVLPNGLTILTKHLPGQQKACVMVSVGVGSIHEEERIQGISHFIEHLAFKSNQRRSAQQIAKDLEYAGTIANAYTTYDNTAFFGKCLPKKVDDTIQILFEAITNTIYKEEEIALERQVVLTEIQNYIELPDRHLISLFLEDQYHKTPYQRRIEGTKKSVTSITQKDLAAFKEKYYAPNNMIISIVGNIDEAKALVTIKKTFGTLAKKIITLPNASLTTLQQKDITIHTQKHLNQSFLAAGFRVAPSHTKEGLGLELLSAILGGGMSSRIFTKLREEQGIGYSVGSAYFTLGNTASLFAYVLGFDKEKRKDALDILKKIFKEITEEIVETQELEGTKNYYISHYLDELQKLEHHAQELIFEERYPVQISYTKRHEFMQKMSAGEILDLAKSYLSDEPTISLLTSEETKHKKLPSKVKEEQKAAVKRIVSKTTKTSIPMQSRIKKKRN